MRLAEAPSFGKPIVLYDVQSVGAQAYMAIADELMRRQRDEHLDATRSASVPASPAPRGNHR